MDDADAFLDLIRLHPDDDGPRLVYADWLDDHGDPARAEFVRVQCALARLPPRDPRHAELRRREAELLDAHRTDWERPLAALGEVGTRFRRGFIEDVTVGAA